MAINYFRRREDAEKTACEAAAFGVKTAVIKAHMGDEAEVQRLVKEAAEQLGGIDIFIGNAASGVLRPVTEIDAKAWDWTININARSILLGARAAIPHMLQKGWGRIITITSIGSRRPSPFSCHSRFANDTVVGLNVRFVRMPAPAGVCGRS